MEILFIHKSKSSSKRLYKYLLLTISLSGLALNILEVYLNFKGTSICHTQGCATVHLFDVHNFLNYLGIIIFLFLSFISLLDSFNLITSQVIILRSLLLSLCLMVEGFFVGFQIWFIKEVCHFCLTIFILVLLCFILDFLSQRHYSFFICGILGFLAIFTATYLVNVNLKPLNLSFPAIVYQKTCPHCEKVIEYAKKHNIKFKSYEVKRAYPLLRMLGLNSVPNLIYKENSTIIILNGDKNIIKWLEEKYVSTKKRVSLRKRKKSKRNKKKVNIKTNSGKKLNHLFNLESSPILIPPQSSDGACELNQPCN